MQYHKYYEVLGSNYDQKNVQGLYTENYKTLSSKINEDINKWKDTLYHVLCTWIGRLNIVGCLLSPKLLDSTQF